MRTSIHAQKICGYVLLALGSAVFATRQLNAQGTGVWGCLDEIPVNPALAQFSSTFLDDH
ncbi:hypothetical protein RAS1_02250 [Phycisphaerae bacterium RAS1]|nr:hypothetical protein RAS1_02250 [Phycisphaerae bacterium RAS1]